MKKLFVLFLALILNFSYCYAIQWEEVKTRNKIVYVDTDSITEYKDSYFYNIKFINNTNNQITILTMQSLKSSPFSARLKAYNPDEYNFLNGDYSNITNLHTTNLEMVTYDSVVFACYKKVKQIKNRTKMLDGLIIE